MDSLYLLIPIALLLVTGAVVLFVWSVKSGQFDDLDTEGKRILFDSETKKQTFDTSSDPSKNTLKDPSENKNDSATRDEEK